MGCTSSQAHNPGITVLTNKKPSVWLIGGGPGCEKGKICQYLIRDYKFKYLSSYDMVQFEQQRGGPDAQLILKLFKQKKTMPSDLIVRLVKKAIASCGVRRFLIDGFPNSIQDVAEFEKQITPKQIEFFGYLNILISQKKMIDSGIQAHLADKNKNRQQIQSNVRQIVKSYIKQSEKIKEQYKKINKYHQINGQQGADKTYASVRQYLEGLGIQTPKPVKVFFSHFDDVNHELIFCDDLTRKYGLYFYTPRGLIQQAYFKTNTPQSQTLRKLQKQNKQVPPSLVLHLIRKKIQKHDYKGSFLFSGYPRFITDAEQWDRSFGWETQILGYLSFQIPDDKFRKVFSENLNKNRPNLKTQELNKEFEKYQANQKQICNYYQKKDMLLLINTQDEKKALNEIHKFFQSKKFYARPRISQSKVVFVSTLNGNGQLCVQSANKIGASIINVQKLLKQKIAQNGLYSQLIESFLKIGKPITSLVIARILLEKIQQNRMVKFVLVQGFPNSQQQLQVWQQQIGQSIDLSIVFLYEQNNKYIEQKVSQKIKQKQMIRKQKQVIQEIKQYSSRLQKRIKKSDWKHYIVKSIDNNSSIVSQLQKVGIK